MSWPKHCTNFDPHDLLKSHPDFLLDTANGLLFGSYPLKNIITTYGSPTWVMHADIIKSRYQKLTQAFQSQNLDVSVHYAVKANSHLAIIKLLAKQGAGVDIVSGGELLRALKAGVPNKKICFSGVGKTHEELRLALKHDIGQINVESKEELYTISKLAQELHKIPSLCLRINPNIDAKTHHKITTGLAKNKFGIDYRDALDLYREGSRLTSLKLIGFDVHIGSQIVSIEPYRLMLERMAELILKAKSCGFNVTHLDCGGGFGINYNDEKEFDPIEIATLFKQIIEPLEVKISIEPGRWLVGPAGVLVSKVILKKDKGPNQPPFVIIDAGMNDLIRPAIYNSWHTIVPIEKSIYQRNKQLQHIDGPICESSDIFARNRILPELHPNDTLAILDSGAYGSVMSSTYNARPLAAQVMIIGDKSILIQPRQLYNDLWKDEIVPNEFY
ncbi:Diaminopimelate decarboxylase [Commensalibacter sp. Nvir]|uniref:diaminopimelate decarboxylase n=1 Tax=Commensalibacter sp. Nvir TaxID=3069817 RepID=UPI002D5F7696|nr:Diaminopimelate decarboxylase [Commensalibacter sp. Nvir]